MILTAHQPAYLPWLGYFDKIIRSDVYVFMDAVQLEKRSFTGRNKIKTPNGETWLTVPLSVKGYRELTIKDIKIDPEQYGWAKKHLQSIALNYRKAPFFEVLFPKLEALYGKHYDYLADMCYEHLCFWLEELGFPSKKIVKSSELDCTNTKSELILEYCQKLHATHYISGMFGKDYLDTTAFRGAGITLEFQSYQHPVYPQLWGEFTPYMSIVDFCMNTNDYGMITRNQRGEFAS
jgi:hypothetical protein